LHGASALQAILPEAFAFNLLEAQRSALLLQSRGQAQSAGITQPPTHSVSDEQADHQQSQAKHQ